MKEIKNSDDVPEGEQERQKELTMPHLMLSNSLIEDVALKHTRNVDQKDAILETGSDKMLDINDNDDFVREKLSLPMIKISTEKPKKSTKMTRKKKEEPQMRKWRVSIKQDWRENTVDTRTIYSKSHDDILKTVMDEGKILPPLHTSPRMAANVPDSQDLHQKILVMKHYFSVGGRSHYRKDKAVLPTVYSNFFSCPERKKKYINSMWLEHFKNRQKDNQDCSRYNKTKGHETKHNCSYCDVMGSKYCSFCMEFKNRHFALSYEGNYLPSIGGLKLAKDLKHNSSFSGEQKSSKLDKPKKHSKQNKHLLMPITQIPEDSLLP